MKSSVGITISIAPAAGQNLDIDVTGVPTTGQVGVPYSGAIQVSGGQGPYSFVLSNGALPDGVSLMSDGTLEGTPTVAGDFSLGIEVTDSQG